MNHSEIYYYLTIDKHYRIGINFNSIESELYNTHRLNNNAFNSSKDAMNVSRCSSFKYKDEIKPINYNNILVTIDIVD